MKENRISSPFSQKVQKDKFPENVIIIVKLINHHHTKLYAHGSAEGTRNLYNDKQKQKSVLRRPILY